MFAITVFILLAQLTAEQRAAVPQVSAAEARDLQQKGEAVLIDVRGSVPYELGHAAGAVWMPLGLVSQRAGELPEDKLIIAYCTCKSEEVSIETALALQKLGFRKVAVMRGGYPAWKDASYPIEIVKRLDESAFADGGTAPASRGRLAPPAAVACDRNRLTSYAGDVTQYRRARGKTTLTIHTDSGTIEKVTITHPKTDDPSRYLLIYGTPMTARDWERIESRKGVLLPKMRAVAWVCTGGPTIVDFRPGEVGGVPR